MLYQPPHELGKIFLHLAIKLKPKFQIIVETHSLLVMPLARSIQVILVSMIVLICNGTFSSTASSICRYFPMHSLSVL